MSNYTKAPQERARENFKSSNSDCVHRDSCNFEECENHDEHSKQIKTSPLHETFTQHHVVTKLDNENPRKHIGVYIANLLIESHNLEEYKNHDEDLEKKTTSQNGN